MTAPHDRDASLARALTRALAREGDAGDACLDAETLAAWVDHGLDAAGAAHAEAHVSSCARCQALVATMARTEAVETGAAADHRSLWRWWFGPLAAAAAATTIWIVMPASEPTPPVPESVIAEAPIATPSLAEAPIAGTPPDTTVAGVPPTAAAESTLAVDARREAVAGVAPQETEAKARPEPAAPRAESAAPDAPPPGAADALRDRAPRPPPAAAPGVATQERAEAPATFAAPAPAAALRAGSALEVAAPDGAARWRVTASRVVERSLDGGRTWTPLAGALDADVRAGAAPSAEVCWLVGANGAVWRTTSTGTFARVTPPGPVDLVAITADDAQSAIVSAADGRRFQTRDGGTTWAVVRE